VDIARYGIVTIETRPGAHCRASVRLPSGNTVLAADFLSEHVADERGSAAWSYATPVAGAGKGRGDYHLSCTAAGQTVETDATFDVP